ncbi:hypothetical protein [uncultured Clostridium sp.]|uniref:hypothetical protein n=1 Tax=uncultured Clostridium sp. TaxID=59620 RepID=UPI002671C441|nr:hypothetical protein [uncultured Clostridium sp.]
MGWFKNSCRAVGRVVGSVIETTGRVLKSETIEKIGRGIKDACTDVSRDTGKTDRYDKEKARLEETKRINMILTEFSLNLENKADEIEKTAIEESKVYFEQLIKELNNSKSDTGINVSRIERTMSRVEREIKGNLKTYISKRVSIDDSECLEILKLEAGYKKENEMKKFSEKILQQGLNNLVKDIKDVIKEQNDIVTEVIEERLEDINSNLDRKIKDFNLLESSKLKTEKEVEKVKKELNLKIKLSEACINSLV